MWGDGVSKVKHSVETYKIKEKERTPETNIELTLKLKWA